HIFLVHYKNMFSLFFIDFNICLKARDLHTNEPTIVLAISTFAQINTNISSLYVETQKATGTKGDRNHKDTRKIGVTA
ncbi:hypothetical protein ACJX0J_024112, partial [Zea mays]